MAFNVGNIVEWTSQSGGVVKAKRGVIESVIPPGKRPAIKGCGIWRNHESYTVRVWEGGRTRLYWPRVAHLKVVY